MSSSLARFLLGFVAFLAVVALYFFTHREHFAGKRLKTFIYWAIPLGFAVYFVFAMYLVNYQFLKHNLQVVNMWIMWLYLLWLPAFLIYVIFSWFDDIYDWVRKPVNHPKVFKKIGYVLIGIVLVFYIHGTLNTRSFEVRRATVEIENLPEGFDGMTIAVMSDTHFGTMYDRRKYYQAVADSVNAAKPDMICFAGDLVNIFLKEVVSYQPIFAGMEGKYGKYGVRGNHDFARYFRWKDENERSTMEYHITTGFYACGFNLLDNKWAMLEKDSVNKLAIVGIDESSTVDNVMAEVPDSLTAILLLHDPNEWDNSVKGKYPNVALTLSGHTHSMQFQLEMFGRKFSPASWVFPYFDGLYTEDDQNLFVTRGLGCVGVPVRIGKKAEFSILTLERKLDNDN